MIPLILKTIASKFNIGISWFKRNFNIIAVIIIGIFTAIFVYQRNQLNKSNIEIDRLYNNMLYYQEMNDSTKDKNHVLQLTINELNNTADSVISELNKTRKELDIKDKELELVSSQTQKVKLDTTIIVKDNDFKYEIKPNSLTSLIIEKQDSILTANLDIKNQQTLFVSNKKEYKNKYKNWFRRLLKFDFKKHNVYRYNIVNSNDLIKVTDTRVIQINE